MQGDVRPAPETSERERFLASVLDSATDHAIVAMDLKGCVTAWNEGARQLLGWAASETLGRPAAAFLTLEDSRSGAWTSETEAASRGEHVVDERWLRRKDGSRFFAHGALTPLRKAGGPVWGMVAVLRDRTEQHLASERCIADAGFLRSVLASSADCIKVVDLDGKLLFMNEGGQRLLEISDFNAIQGCPWPDFWAGDKHREARAAVVAARAGGCGAFQGIANTASGAPKWWDVQVTPILGAQGQPEKLLVVSRDITELKRTEQSLALSRERLGLALEASEAICIWDWDVVADAIYADANAARLHGVDPARAAGGAPLREFTQLVHPDDLPQFQAALDRARSASDEFACEYRVARPDGSPLWLLARGRLVRDATGAAIRLPGNSVDITERKLAEERQLLLMQELAHRVKNTLAMVQAIASQSLRGEGSLSEARQAFAARLMALAQAHDVLLQGSWTAASLRGLVDGAVRLLGHDDPGRFRIEGDDVTLGPPAALSFALVLYELGTNAVKYGALSTPDGHVAANWRREVAGGEAWLRFQWRELGGPPVSTPRQQGFGTRLIERSLTQGLGATVQLDYEASGVTFAMAAPLAALQRG